jgi:membrane-associated phospholipid phosphatase
MQQELALNTTGEQPAILKVFGKIVSYILHPLFIPLYVFIWLEWRFPIHFDDISAQGQTLKAVSVFLNTAFFPVFSVFLLWRLKFIDTIFLRTQKDRIIPYIITMIFYWWLWYLSRTFTDQPDVLKFFYFGIFLNTVFGLVINNFIKISMHSMGAGALVAFAVITMGHYETFLGADIIIITILAGLICTSRLLLNQHSVAEIYAGLFVGVLCQLLGYWIAL